MKEWLVPDIDRKLCTNCGRCVEMCPTNAVRFVAGRPVIVAPQDCVYCGTCEDICPENAIALSYEITWQDTPPLQ